MHVCRVSSVLPSGCCEGEGEGEKGLRTTKEESPGQALDTNQPCGLRKSHLTLLGLNFRVYEIKGLARR